MTETLATGPGRHPRHHLTVAQAKTLPVSVLAQMIDDRFEDLVALSIADARGDLSRSVSDLLRSPERHLDWNDALVWAEGDLQVRAEWAAYVGTDELPVIAARLKAVRRRLHESRMLIRDNRRRDLERGPEHRAVTDAEATARKWLAEAFPGEFKQLLDTELAVHGIVAPLNPSSRDVFDTVEHGYREGWLEDPMTPEVDRLLRASERAMREITARDARAQDARNDALCHPLLLRRWHIALQQLGEECHQRAGAASPNAVGPTPQLLNARSRDHDDATRAEAKVMLETRRFLAAIIQRRIECARLIRDAVDDLANRQQRDPQHVEYSRAKNRARHRLAAQRSDELAGIRDLLRPYESSAGHIDTTLLRGGRHRGAVKRRAVAAARSISTATDRPVTPATIPGSDPALSGGR